jgi:orotate phosphoribosyltransferase
MSASCPSRRLPRRRSWIAPFEHRVLLTGYRPQHARARGPLEGGAFLAYTVADRLGVAFLAGYRTPGVVAAYHLPPVRDGIGGRRVAVTDDAVNAGPAVAACLGELRGQGAVPVAVGAVIALGEASTMVPARLGVPFHTASTMPSRAWPEQECPLCADGIPVTPGADDGRSAGI